MSIFISANGTYAKPGGNPQCIDEGRGTLQESTLTHIHWTRQSSLSTQCLTFNYLPTYIELQMSTILDFINNLGWQYIYGDWLSSKWRYWKTHIVIRHGMWLVLAIGPNSQVGSGSSSTRNRTAAMVLTIPKTRTVGNRPVLPSKTRQFKFTILAPIKYLSSDCMMTSSVHRLCSFSRSFTSRSQICDRRNICSVAIENLRILLNKWCYFTPSQRILVRLQIWDREVKAAQMLHILRIHHVMKRRDLRHLIGAIVWGNVNWNHSAGTTRPKNCGFMSGPGNNPARTKRVGILAGFVTELNRTAGQNSDHWSVTQTRC